LRGGFTYLKRSDLTKLNTLLIRRFGIPKRNLEFPDPLSMLIGTILSQNTNDNNSFKAYNNLVMKYPTWDMLAGTKTQEIEKVIRVAGLGNQKAKAIKKVVKYLLNSRGEVSLDYLRDRDNQSVLEELVSLDGVGLKTASCVLLFSLDRNICPVDTHVHRTMNRIGLVKASAPDKTFMAINQVLPEGIGHQLHTNLIKLGRTYCKPSNPLCKSCPVEKICKYEKKTDKEGKIEEKNFMLLDNI
jgi:endonuclease-3